MKKNTTRRALTLSVLSLVMCVAMLVGTTFAWFTDSVTSGRNKIQSGNLDVELEYWNGSAYASVTEDTKLFDDDALWEPGHTEVAYLKVSNAGSLALKYQLAVNVYNEVLGKTKEGADIKLSDYLVFSVINNKQIESADDLYTRETAIAAAGANMGLETYGSGTKALPETGDADYVALVIYMPTSVGNEANHNGVNVPYIEMGVTLVATQYTYEEDSFGSNYDADATYPITISDAKAAGEELDLTAGDVEIGVPAAAPAGNYTLDVADKEVTVNAAGQTSVAYDINLYKDGVKVSDDGTAYTVSIDIGAGHTDILSVLHNGDAITVFDYDFTTGIITFTTNSFSPFEVYFKAPEIQWDGEVSVEEPANVRFDEANRIIYISGAEGFTYLDTLAAEWDSKINNFNAYYYYWDWTVELLTDVDFGGKAYSVEKFIWGGFNGNGNTISNVNVEGCGLFNHINGAGNKGLKNLTVENITVDGNAKSYVGAVVGALNTYAENVHVKNAAVKGNKYVGGLFGACFGNVKNCSVTDANVSITAYGEKTIGGLVGYALFDSPQGTAPKFITNNVISDVTVIGTYNVGGIVGQLQGASGTITLEGNTIKNSTVISTVELPESASSNEKRVDAVAARLVGDAVVGENTVIDVDVQELQPDRPTNLPEATITVVPNETIEWGSFGGFEPNDPEQQLDIIYEFSAKDTPEEAAASAYANWITDYYVSFTADLEGGELLLGGNYGSFGWVGFNNPDEYFIEKNTWIPLLGSVTQSGWTYQDIISFVGTFKCGVALCDDTLAGNTFSVQLRITNPDDESEYFVINQIDYQF